MPAARPRFDPTVNYYQILDVAYGATSDEIVRAYRQLMRMTHPDRFQDPRQRAKAEERTKLINVAYGVLSKPEIRREYDEQMRSTVVADTIMQRYTSMRPGQSGLAHASPKPPAPHVVRERRRAYNSAVRQILSAAAAFALLVLAFVLVIFVLPMLIGGFIA
ncbi:MAG: J domain-containing protein [Thermomicrobiales bacterium]|nr:J domain-containing protein [Thermomicrobiales bacterium]